MERSILTDFAFFYRKSLNEKMNGSMKENVHGSKRSEKPKTVVKELKTHLSSPYRPHVFCK